jgi:isopropylmalate/homocitrate/citramalate synthase
MSSEPTLPDWVDTKAFGLDARLDSNQRWVSSPVNEIAVPREAGEMSRHIVVRDDTLRSGSNTPGVFASHDKKLRIAEALEDMGVQEAEVGYGSLADDREFVSKLRKRGTRMNLGMHARSWLPQWKADVDGIADCGGDLVNFVGMQGYTLSHALHPQLRGEAFFERMEECIAYAKGKGLKVAFGTDHPRPELIAPTVRRAMAAGVDRWVVYDARGWLVPQAMALQVSLARAACEDKIEITVHAHDDFGLATINSFEGIRAGAMGCDTCINRTGHRCGNAAFEQVAVGLPYFYGYETGIDLAKITAVSKLVSELYEVPVSENTPIVGHNMFSYGGLHINGILRGDWFLWENLKAETVGSGRHIVYGPTALQGGTDSPLEAKVVASAGKSPSEAQLERVMAGVRELIDQKKFATDEEVERIISRVMG